MITSFLIDLFTKLDFRLNPVPKAYGILHLTFFFLGLALVTFAAYKLRNVSTEKGDRILFFVGLALAVTEVYKQLYFTFGLNEGNYPWYIFPFQLCSVPMYLCLIIRFVKNEGIRKKIFGFLTFYNLFGGFVTFMEPSGILQKYGFLTIHSLCWHMTLIFIGLFLIFSGRVGTKLSDYKDATVMYLILCCVAFSMNLIFREISSHEINMFFLGPNVSPIIVFQGIGEKYGWYIGTLAYIPSICLAGFIVFSIVRAVKKNSSKKKKA